MGVDLDLMEQMESIQEEQNKPISAMRELRKRLKEEGDLYIEEHKTVVKEGTPEEYTKYPHVSDRAMADILQRNAICRVINEDDPESSPFAVYDFDEGIYKKGDRFINRLLLNIDRRTHRASRAQAIDFLTVESDEVALTSSEYLVCVNNGVFNRETRILEPFNPQYVFVNKIGTNYIEGASEPIFDGWSFTDWINELSDSKADKLQLIKQMLASSVNPNYIPEVAFILVSAEGSTGKSTLQQLLINIVGLDNVASLKINQFEKNFTFATAYGKSLIVGDDNNPKAFLDTSENFKSTVTGDLVQIEAKREKPFSTHLKTTIVQSMNDLPRFGDHSDGLIRRLRAIEFNTAHKGAKRNKRVKTEYIFDERLHEYILFKSLNLEFSSIVNTEESQAIMYELKEENDPVFNFYNEVVENLESEGLPSDYLFKLFQAWSKYTNNATRMKQRTFTTNIKNIMVENGWKFYSKNVVFEDMLAENDIQKIIGYDYQTGTNFSYDPLKRQSGYLKE